MTDWRQTARSFAAWDEKKYEAIDLNRLMVFVIAQLQEAQVPTTFEALTVAAFRQFPMKFGLVGFPDYPDAARVNRALLQLRPKYRNWATGDVKRGFVLNEGGRRIVMDVRQQLESTRQRGVMPRTRDDGRTKDLTADLQSVESSGLYKTFADTHAVDPGRADDFYSLLGAYPYAPRRALRDRLDALRVTANQAGRATTEAFLTELKRTYKALLQDV